MSDCVRETLCTNCVHRNVCSLKMSYLELLTKLPSVSPDFSLILSCKYYLKEAQTLRTNMADLMPDTRVVYY